MSQKRSLKSVEGANRSLRHKLNLQDELLLAAAPTVTVLGVMALVEALSRQRLLFASLASSAFLIYLDPQHGTNTASSPKSLWGTQGGNAIFRSGIRSSQAFIDKY